MVSSVTRTEPSTTPRRCIRPRSSKTVPSWEAGRAVWHRGHIREGSRIGRDCTLGFAVYVDTDVVVGDNCKIQNHVSLYRGRRARRRGLRRPVRRVHERSCIPARDRSSGRCVRRTCTRGASIGANATIVCGVDIGAWAMIAAGAIVTADVPAYGLDRRRAGPADGLGVPLRRALDGVRTSAAVAVPALRSKRPHPRVERDRRSTFRCSAAEEEALVLEVLRSGRLVKGPMVERFEDAVRHEVGTRHAIAVNSGTSALVAALLAHGIRPATR